jgi:CheY-like chemotaxis protein
MLGYTVLVAEDGAEALELIERQPASVDLLLTDVMMPRLGGPALAEEFLARAPGGRVLYISGFSDAALPEGPRRALLPKPFAPAQLAQRVRRALDEPRL